MKDLGLPLTQQSWPEFTFPEGVPDSEPAEQLPAHWRLKFGAELAKDGPGRVSVDLEMTGLTLKENTTRTGILDTPKTVAKSRRGSVEHSMREQLHRGELPRPYR